MNATPLVFPPIVDFEDTAPDELGSSRFSTLDVRSEAPTSKQNSLSIVRESHPRIAELIELGWGSRDLEERFTRWVLTDQEGRRGWSCDVLGALLDLHHKHACSFNFDVTPIWGEKPDRW